MPIPEIPETVIPETVIPEPEILDTEVSEAAEAAPAEEWVDFDFSGWDGEDIEQVPERLRGAATFFQGQLQTAKEAREAAIAEAQSKTDYHKNMWQTMLREEDPERYSDYEKQIAAAKLDAANKQTVIDAIAADKAALQEQFTEHTRVSNEQYLTWVEQKWTDELKTDREAGGDIIKSAEELVVELNVDPDDALELGFKHGLGAMADFAEMITDGVAPEKAMKLVKRLNPIKAAPEPEPEPIVVAAPPEEPAARHSSSADLSEEIEAPREPVRMKKGGEGFSFDGDSLHNLVTDVAADLFSSKQFRR